MSSNTPSNGQPRRASSVGLSGLAAEKRPGPMASASNRRTGAVCASPYAAALRMIAGSQASAGCAYNGPLAVTKTRYVMAISLPQYSTPWVTSALAAARSFVVISSGNARVSATPPAASQPP